MNEFYKKRLKRMQKVLARNLYKRESDFKRWCL